MTKRGDKKKFKDFVNAVKQDPHRYFYIKSTLTKLKEEEIDVSTQGYLGQTLLHVALKLNDIKLFNLFIKAGVNINIANEYGDTPLHKAVNDGKIKFIRALANSGCDLNIGASQEQTPLHLAAINGNIEIVKYLVDHGADVDMLDETNCLPIDYAIEEKDEKMIIYFMSKQELDQERKDQIDLLLSREGEKNA
ncbi:MAG TPA: ankyrin repeat domain-containing protein [Bacilli bacterium]|nr:ankyrin repeat domain-containing protein [Bacilli bacterium]